MDHNPRAYKEIILLAFIIIFGFFYRFFMAHIAWIDADEGSYLYDASLLLKGLDPYKDYFTRNPFYLGMLAVFIKLFGHNLLAGRLFSVITTTVSIYFMYRIGDKLYDKNTGILVSFIYGFSPYTAFWNSQVKNQAAQTVFVVVAVYLFLDALEKEKKMIFFLGGLFLGIAFLIRESALLLLLIEVIILFYFRKSARFFLWACIGFCIPLLAYLYFSEQAGTGIFLHSILNSFLWMIGGFGLNYLFEEDVDIVKNFFFFCKEALYLVIPTFIFFCLLLKELLTKRYKKAISVLFYFLILTGFSICLYWIFTSSFKWLFVKISYLVVSFKVLLAFIFSALFLSSLYLFRKSKDTHKQELFSHIFCSLWFVLIFLVYLLRKRFYFSYLPELLPALSLITGFTIISLFRQKRIPKSVYTVFIISLVGSALLTQVFYYQGYRLDRFYSVNENKHIAEFLREHTLQSEEIFTANNVVLFCAERRAVYDISYPNFYSYREVVSSPQRFNYPKVSEIMNYLESDKIRYCLIDPWTEKYFFVHHPQLKEYIYSHYQLEKEIGDAKIYIRK